MYLGTGANHLGALFLSRFYSWNGPPKVYISNPTWGDYLLFFFPCISAWQLMNVRNSEPLCHF